MMTDKTLVERLRRQEFIDGLQKRIEELAEIRARHEKFVLSARSADLESHIDELYDYDPAVKHRDRASLLAHIRVLDGEIERMRGDAREWISGWKGELDTLPPRAASELRDLIGDDDG